MEKDVHNVDNVDKKVEDFYGKPEDVEKTRILRHYGELC